MTSATEPPATGGMTPAAAIRIGAAAAAAAALIILARPGGRTRPLAGGALLALAVWTKVTPVLVGPAVLRRRPVALLSAAATASR
jgi:hypothetical protein